MAGRTRTKPLVEFFHTEAVGGNVLLLAALTARMRVNDVVMAIFVLLVGLETTREVLVGVLAPVAPGACAQGSDDSRHHDRSTVTTRPNAATGTMRPGAANQRGLMTLAPGLSRVHQITLPCRPPTARPPSTATCSGVPLLFTAPPGHEPPGSVLYFAVADTGAIHTALAAKRRRVHRAATQDGDAGRSRGMTGGVHGHRGQPPGADVGATAIAGRRLADHGAVGRLERLVDDGERFA